MDADDVVLSVEGEDADDREHSPSDFHTSFGSAILVLGKVITLSCPWDSTFCGTLLTLNNPWASVFLNEFVGLNNFLDSIFLGIVSKGLFDDDDELEEEGTSMGDTGREGGYAGDECAGRLHAKSDTIIHGKNTNIK